MSKTILIAEDELLMRQALADTLTASGYKVVLAENGRQALDKTTSEKPDLILLDVMMPLIDGFGVLKSLKAKKETASIPVIVLTNLGQQSDVATATQLGAVSYLVKSETDPTMVAKEVARVLKSS